MGGAPWLASAAPRFFSGGAWANLTLLGTAPAPPLTGFRSGKSWRWSTTGAGGVGALLPRGSRASADGSGAAALRNPNVSLAPEPGGDKNSMRKEGRTTAVKTKREAEGTALAPACPRSSLTKRTRPATARAGVPASTGRRPKRRAAS